MEETHTQLKSIWGKWWQPIRKWFYPSWLIYETSIRFYDYAISVHTFLKTHHSFIEAAIGEIGTLAFNLFCSVATFAVCLFFLTYPACFVLYQFFNTNNLTGTLLEEKIKPLF